MSIQFYLKYIYSDAGIDKIVSLYKQHLLLF